MILLAVSVSVALSKNLTSYALLLINICLCYVPIGLPSFYSFLILTSACISTLSDPPGNPNSMLTYASLGKIS